MEDCLSGLYFDMAQFCQNLVIFSPLNAVLSAVVRVSGGCLVSGVWSLVSIISSALSAQPRPDTISVARLETEQRLWLSPVAAHNGHC